MPETSTQCYELDPEKRVDAMDISQDEKTRIKDENNNEFQIGRLQKKQERGSEMHIAYYTG